MSKQIVIKKYYPIINVIREKDDAGIIEIEKNIYAEEYVYDVIMYCGFDNVSTYFELNHATFGELNELFDMLNYLTGHGRDVILIGDSSFKVIKRVDDEYDITNEKVRNYTNGLGYFERSKLDFGEIKSLWLEIGKYLNKFQKEESVVKKQGWFKKLFK